VSCPFVPLHLALPLQSAMQPVYVLVIRFIAVWHTHVLLMTIDGLTEHTKCVSGKMLIIR
jgi:hypothetical protein